MLYTGDMNKSLLPEAVRPGPHYHFWADLKLNSWALVAVVFAFASRWFLQHHHNWSEGLQAGVALAPLLPSLLYVRSLARWISGMDELQRRIQLEACLFATTLMVLVATALSLLGGLDLLQGTRLQRGLGWEGTFAATVAFYILGNVIFNRRYR